MWSAHPRFSCRVRLTTVSSSPPVTNRTPELALRSGSNLFEHALFNCLRLQGYLSLRAPRKLRRPQLITSSIKVPTPSYQRIPVFATEPEA